MIVAAFEAAPPLGAILWMAALVAIAAVCWFIADFFRKPPAAVKPIDVDGRVGQVNAKAQSSESKAGEAGEKNALVNEVEKPWPR